MRFILAPFILFLHVLTANSQILNNSEPPSFSLPAKSGTILPAYTADSLNTETLINQDKEFPLPLRYGVCRPLQVNLPGQGLADEIPGKGRIWRYLLESRGAKALAINFSTFRIPEGGGLWLYDESHSSVLGAITSENNQPGGFLTTRELPSESIVIEYFEPYNAPFHGCIILSELIHAYREMDSMDPESVSGSLASNISTRCPSALPYWYLKHAVCKMTFNDRVYAYLCTGFLINNTSRDGTPYFATANHCIGDSAVCPTLVTYFNYEDEKCGVSAPETRTISGSKFLFTFPASDFTLLRLNQNPPASYSPVYAGWDISNQASIPVNAIHHPDGTPKVVSLSVDPVTSYPSSLNWNGGGYSPANSHWEVHLTTGKTIGGSSGCPLFDSNGRAIGQLHGGDETRDFFGKLSYTAKERATLFNKYLDPSGTGLKFIDALIPDTNYPESFFDTDIRGACLNAPVSLFNQSTFDPDTFQWTITNIASGLQEGYQFVEASSSASANPVLRFTKPGSYSLSLSTGKKALRSLTKRTAFIAAQSSINLAILDFPTAVLCGYKLNDYRINSTGALTYRFDWGDKADRFEISENNGTATLSLKPDMEKLGGFELPFTLTGSHGSCSTSLSKTLRIGLAINNEPENAIPLVPGVNRLFNNACADAFPNEPFPVEGTCNTQYTWCSASYTNGNPLQNSVWFKLTGPASGKLNIILRGFDAQMALYRADEATDFRENTALVHLAAANDNQSNTYEPQITSLPVVPGREYWLQVDGGQNGLEDTFSLVVLTDLVSCYPNPTAGKFTIDAGIKSSAEVNIDILEPSGRILFTQIITTSEDGERYPVDISTLPRGFYLIRYRSEKVTSLSKILKI